MPHMYASWLNVHIWSNAQFAKCALHHHLTTKALEKVQKRATKILPQLKHMNYSDRLKACKLLTLHYRRIRGDMIETYKILTGKYDIETAPPWLGFVPQSSSSSHMCVINHNWSATKQCLHPQSVAEISRHSVLSGNRIRQCETSSGSRHKPRVTGRSLEYKLNRTGARTEP